MREPLPEEFTLYRKLPLAEVHYSHKFSLALVVTTGNFIPFPDFQKIFEVLEEVIAEHGLRRTLFDKRSLTIFHQPSMEWYYLNWKASMLQKYNVVEHGKILPKDDFFRKSVELAREMIFKENPTHPIHKLKIIYKESFHEALENQEDLKG